MSAISTLVSPSGSMSLASKKYHNVDGRSYECSIHSRPRDLSELGDKQKGSQAVAHVMFRVGQNSIKHTGTLGATAVGDNILSVDVDPIPVDHRAPETQVGEGFSVVAWVDSDKAYRAKVTEHGPDVSNCTHKDCFNWLLILSANL